MSDPLESLHLKLPYLAAAQAQKHVTHNEALGLLDSIVQLAVLDRDLTAPPGAPAEGDRYMPASGATGAWIGKDLNIAVYQDGAWSFLVPQIGWRCWVADEKVLLVWQGAPAYWTTIQGGDTVARLGINTAADATNRLAVKSNAVLLSHDDVTPGTGDMLTTLNKSAAAKDAGFAFQTGFSTRALAGLFGSDNYTLKVSPDGATFREAVIADKATGKVSFPQGILDQASGLSGSLYVPAPPKELWRTETAANVTASTPRTYTIAAVSGATITLTTAKVGEIYNSLMRNVSMVRIWNTSKTPAQSAWVNWDNSTTQLAVQNAANIATWGNGETIRLGDPNPTGDATLEMIAIDISNYLYNNLGAVFRQKGINVMVQAGANGAGAYIGVSGNGAGGTMVACYAQVSDVANMVSYAIPTTVQSPISNSNLFYVRQNLGLSTAFALCLVRMLGVYV